MLIFFVENCLKIRNYMEVIENILRYVKKQKSQNQQMSYFSPLCQLHLSISQNRPVQLVACLLECMSFHQHLLSSFMWPQPKMVVIQLNLLYHYTTSLRATFLMVWSHSTGLWCYSLHGHSYVYAVRHYFPHCPCLCLTSTILGWLTFWPLVKELYSKMAMWNNLQSHMSCLQLQHICWDWLSRYFAYI